MVLLLTHIGALKDKARQLFVSLQFVQKLRGKVIHSAGTAAVQQPSRLPQSFQPAPRRVQQRAPHGDALAVIFTAGPLEDLHHTHGGKLLTILGRLGRLPQSQQ